jgi:hypothetical protein
MHSGKTVFKQLLQFLPRYEFNLSASRYRGEHWVKKFSSYDQFLCLAYAQMAGRESLRDIETCLNSHQEKLYHIGFRSNVSRTTLADANERRDWRIFQDFGHFLSYLPALYSNLMGGKCLTYIGTEGWLRWSLHECQALYRHNTWLPPAPREIFALTENRSSVLVRSGEELLEIIIVSLRRLEQKLHGVTPMARFLWNGDRPKDENDFSDYVENHLKEDLKGRGIVANREVEFRRLSQSGVGEKTDIVVDAIRKNNGGFESITVVIESKGCWHKELQTAMESQLLQRYLIDDQHRHGLYLIGWFSCDQWSDSDYRKMKTPEMTIDEAQAFYDKQAAGLSNEGRLLRALVLNAALPGK